MGKARQNGLELRAEAVRLVRGSTVNFTPEAVEAIATAMVKNGTSVWHEATMWTRANGKPDAKCHCFKCETAAKQVVWLGDAKCDICKQEIRAEGDVMYDARTHSGAWAKMCGCCHGIHSDGRLGVGRGQKYQRTGGKMVKVEG